MMSIYSRKFVQSVIFVKSHFIQIQVTVKAVRTSKNEVKV